MDEPIPDALLCPITQEIMRNPVMAADGHSYDRHAMQTWLGQGRVTSPLTNEELASLELYPNHALRAKIQDFVSRRKTSCRHVLLEQLAMIHENKRHDFDDALFQASFISVDDAVVDTLSITAAILVGWKHDLDVAKETLLAIGRALDHDTTTNPLIVSRATHLRLFPLIMETLHDFESEGPLQEVGISTLARVIRHRSFSGGQVDMTRASESLIKVLRKFPADTSIHLAALTCMHEITSCSPNCINKAGLCRILNQSMKSFEDDQSLQHQGILISGNVSCTTVANKLCSSGVCKRIIEAMLRFSTCHDILYDGSLALSRIYHSRSACEDAACIVVMNALQHDAAIVEVACRAAARLMLIDRHEKHFHQLDIFPVLCEKLGESSASIETTKAIVHVMEMLTLSYNEDQESNTTFFSGPEVYPHLYHILKVPNYDRDLYVSVLNLVYTLLSRATECNLAFHKPIVDIMRTNASDEDIQIVGWGILTKLCEHEQDGPADMVWDALHVKGDDPISGPSCLPPQSGNDPSSGGGPASPSPGT